MLEDGGALLTLQPSHECADASVDVADAGPETPEKRHPPALMIPSGTGTETTADPAAAGRRRASPMYTTERPWEDGVPAAAAARGREVELQEKRSVPKAKREGADDDDDVDEQDGLLGQQRAAHPEGEGVPLPAMDGIPRYFKASWPSTYEQIMHTVRPAVDVYFLCALWFVTWFSPPTDEPGTWVVWRTLDGHRFLLIWLPFWWRFFRSFLHFVISLAIIPGPLIYNEGPLTRLYPKWLLEHIREGNMYRELLRPRLEKAGGITLQLISADGVAVDAMYFRGDAAAPNGPTVVRFNGNAEAFELQDPMFPSIYTQNGLNLIIFNYRGVGRSRWLRLFNNDMAGTLCGLWRTPSVNGTAIDAWTMLEFVLKELRVPPKKVVLLGHSIGGAIATHLAASKPSLPVSLCNSRSFGYLSSVAVHLSPHFLGIPPGTAKAKYLRMGARAFLWLAGWEYRSLDNWGKAPGFKWIEYSGADHIIPYEHSLHHCLTGKQEQAKRNKDGKGDEDSKAAPVAAPPAPDNLRVIALIDTDIDNHNRMLVEPELYQHLTMVMEAVGWSPTPDDPA